MQTNACSKPEPPRRPQVEGRFDLMGTPMDPVTMPEAVRMVREAVSARRPLRHVAMNAAKLVAMRRDPVLRESVETADLVTADGQSIVWASRILGHRLPERVTGIDLMDQVLALAALCTGAPADNRRWCRYRRPTCSTNGVAVPAAARVGIAVSAAAAVSAEPTSTAAGSAAHVVFAGRRRQAGF